MQEGFSTSSTKIVEFRYRTSLEIEKRTDTRVQFKIGRIEWQFLLELWGVEVVM